MKKKNLLQEENFIIGIDLGVEVATISFFEHHSMKAVIYDMSGGYGKSQIPILMQYIPDENDWLIGENTHLDEQLAGDTYLDQLMLRLSKGQPIRMFEKEYPVEDLLATFIRKILESFSHLNPHAVIERIVIAIPDDLYIEKGKFLEERWEQDLNIPLSILSVTQAVIYVLDEKGVNFSTVKYLINCDNDALSAMACIKKNGEISIKELLWDSSISIKKLEDDVEILIENLYLDHEKKLSLSQEEKRQLELLYRQYMPLIFQKYALGKSIKLYFNFAYPPFQSVMNIKKLEELIEPIQDQLKKRIQELILFNQKPIIPMGQGLKFGFVRDCFADEMMLNEYKPTEAAAIGAVICALRIKGNHPLLKFEIEDNPDEIDYFLRIQGNEQAGIVVLDRDEKLADTIVMIDLEENINTCLELVHKRKHFEEKVIREYLIQPFEEQMQVRIWVKFQADDMKNTQIAYLPL